MQKTIDLFRKQKGSEDVQPGQKIWKRFRRHPGAVAGSIILGILILSVLLAPLSPYDPNKSDVAQRLQPPSWQHPMGTDGLGRDLLTRVLFGGRISLSVGLMVVAITLTIGVSIGAAAGYLGGMVESVLMRITDAALTLPAFLVLILLSAILREVEFPLLQKNSVLTIALVIGLLSWMTFARLVRAAIIEESGLSFLGFGIQPPTASWGNLLSNAQENLIRYPWMAIFPGIMIFLAIISVNYIGDGLRDAFDPYKVLGKVGEL
jgi:peptide/nickel transport system permease protein